MSTINVRKLTVLDALNIAEMVDETLSGMDSSEIQKLFTGKDSQEVGLKVIQAALKQTKRSVLTFLADVNQMTREEFLQCDAEVIPSTVSAILSDPRNSGFFGQLRAMLPAAQKK